MDYVLGLAGFYGLADSVGLGGINRPEDVGTVQKLLQLKGYYKDSCGQCRVDHSCGIFTVQAIKQFQAKYVMLKPDGLITPGKKTWKQLVSPNPIPRVGPPASPVDIMPVPVSPLPTSGGQGEVCFPVAHSKVQGALDRWHTPPSQRVYLAARSWNDAANRYLRAHAGVDIYTNGNAEVYACTAGKVVEYAPNFATGVQGVRLAAIAIEHENTHVGKIIVRYGEMRTDSVPADLKVIGASVAARRVLGTTWRVQGVENTMLHLETYSGTATAPFTVSDESSGVVAITYNGRGLERQQAKTRRRTDLINPYDFLIGCMNNSPA